VGFGDLLYFHKIYCLSLVIFPFALPFLLLFVAQFPLLRRRRVNFPLTSGRNYYNLSMWR